MLNITVFRASSSTIYEKDSITQIHTKVLFY